jgi:hypothetical protein
MRVGDRLESRTAPPPQLDEQQIRERQAKAVELAAQYQTEILAS